MNTSRALHTMKGIQDAVRLFGAGVPQSEKDFLNQIIVKLENGTPLASNEQQFVDEKVKAVFDDNHTKGLI